MILPKASAIRDNVPIVGLELVPLSSLDRAVYSFIISYESVPS